MNARLPKHADVASAFENAPIWHIEKILPLRWGFGEGMPIEEHRISCRRLHLVVEVSRMPQRVEDTYGANLFMQKEHLTGNEACCFTVFLVNSQVLLDRVLPTSSCECVNKIGTVLLGDFRIEISRQIWPIDCWSCLAYGSMLI